MLVHRTLTGGDIDGALARAAVRLRRTFRINRGIGRPIEGRGSLAAPDPVSGGLSLWSSSQIPDLVRTKLSEVLEIPEHQLRVRLLDIGGGFGTKNGLFPEEVVVAWAAKRLGRACRWLETEHEALLCSSHGHDHRYDIEIAATPDGRLEGVRVEILVDVGAYSHWPWTAALEPVMAAGLLPGPYKIPHYRAETFGVATNKPPVGPLRGVARPSTTFVLERMLEELAQAIGADPVRVRRQNLVESGDFPYRSATNVVYSDGSYVEALDLLHKHLEYDSWRSRQAEARPGEPYLGIGVACVLELGGIGSAMPVAPGAHLRPGIDGVSMRIEPTGVVTIVAAVPSIGQDPEGTFVQIVARKLGVRPDVVTLVREDASAAPYSMGVFAGRGATIIGSVVALAASHLRERVLSFAGHLLSTDVDRLQLVDGRIHRDDRPTTLTLEEVAKTAYFGAHRRPPGAEPGLAVTKYYDPGFGVIANGAHGVVVEVDPELGTVRVLRYVAVTDCGEVLNTSMVEGQVLGSVAYGLGLVLHELLTYGSDGRIEIPGGTSYALPRAGDMPPIEMAFLRTPAGTPSGAKPVGQMGTIAAPAAVANAISDALRPLGIGIWELPVMPGALWETLRRREAGLDSGFPAA